MLKCLKFIFVVVVQPRYPKIKTLQKAHASLIGIVTEISMYTSPNTKYLGIFGLETYGITRVCHLGSEFSHWYRSLIFLSS